MSIWHIDSYKPRSPIAQPTLDSAYLYDEQRQLPDLQAGFRVQSSDQAWVPAPSYLFLENGARLPQVDPYSWDSSYESFIQTEEDFNQGLIPPLDSLSKRDVNENEDGYPREPKPNYGTPVFGGRGGKSYKRKEEALYPEQIRSEEPEKKSKGLSPEEMQSESERFQKMSEQIRNQPSDQDPSIKEEEEEKMSVKTESVESSVFIIDVYSDQNDLIFTYSNGKIFKQPLGKSIQSIERQDIGKKPYFKVEFTDGTSEMVKIPLKEGPQGPPGPQGPQGPRGPPGQRGEMGPAGPEKMQRISVPSVLGLSASPLKYSPSFPVKESKEEIQEVQQPINPFVPTSSYIDPFSTVSKSLAHQEQNVRKTYAEAVSPIRPLSSKTPSPKATTTARTVTTADIKESKRYNELAQYFKDNYNLTSQKGYDKLKSKVIAELGEDTWNEGLKKVGKK